MAGVNAVTGEPLVERGSKVAKCLVNGPSEWELVVLVVVVPVELVEAMTPVEIARMVGGVEVVLVLVQMPATEMVLGRRVRGSRKSVLVDDAAAGEVAT